MTRPALARTVAALALDLVAAIFLLDLRVTDPGRLADPAVQVTALTQSAARFLGLALAGYVALVLLALLLTALPRTPVGLRRAVERRTGRGPAAAIRWAVGASALTLGILPGTAVHATGAAPVLAPLEEPDPAPPTLAPADTPDTPAGPQPPPSVVPPTSTVVPAPPDPAVPAVPPPDRPDPVRAGPVEVVIVAPGDSFWSVAERLLAGRLGRPPGDAEVVEPWLALIEANRAGLVDPSDPDLLQPGQTLRLPPGLSGS